MIYSIVVLTLFTNCEKDKGTTVYEYPVDLQQNLTTYAWLPITSSIEEENNLVNYKPDDCELDNRYHFVFQDKSNEMTVDKGTKKCTGYRGGFEKSIFKRKNRNVFSFNKEKGSIKFSDSDAYSSYLLVVVGDKLILTYHNNNPTANVVPVKYYFKGVKK